MGSIIYTRRGICYTYPLRFTSGATLADLLVASMVVKPFFYIYLQAGIGGTQNWDLSCHYCRTVWYQVDTLPTELCWLTSLSLRCCFNLKIGWTCYFNLCVWISIRCIQLQLDGMAPLISVLLCFHGCSYKLIAACTLC